MDNYFSQNFEGHPRNSCDSRMFRKSRHICVFYQLRSKILRIKCYTRNNRNFPILITFHLRYFVLEMNITSNSTNICFIVARVNLLPKEIIAVHEGSHLVYYHNLFAFLHKSRRTTNIYIFKITINIGSETSV